MKNLDLIKIRKKSYNWLIINWRTLIIGTIIPLLIFSILAWKVSEAKKGFSWDIFILLQIHTTAQPFLDQIAQILTQLGDFPKITGLLIPIIILLIYQKKWRQLAYFIITLLGKLVISVNTKIFFHRIRPHLWESMYSRPEDFSFPSGHAMGSMTLVMILLMITWGSRWSLLVGIFGSLFVLVIAWTRLYLGVHFPSDILGGWMLAIVWTIGMSLLFNIRQSNRTNLDA
ncbi:phosphatase PAP2 family protein [Aphanothece sacrum]|uniref:PA-phosphatase n=1 Tax=Aphanothece sacrum FPU1 TaxID=1920663 RepID=A0A401IJX3_APHSA|nr:phosphatase PAP2 family protein [Aphanothece sacrum]GBF81516.1 PA-phosphatase [Aphanothece sacrum FPU1]GBF86320.1 hypothetical protein AsFPU3_3391 [Aphanothece sacrum FPU3]